MNAIFTEMSRQCSVEAKLWAENPNLRERTQSSGDTQRATGLQSPGPGEAVITRTRRTVRPNNPQGLEIAQGGWEMGGRVDII